MVCKEASYLEHMDAIGAGQRKTQANSGNTIRRVANATTRISPSIATRTPTPTRRASLELQCVVSGKATPYQRLVSCKNTATIMFMRSLIAVSLVTLLALSVTSCKDAPGADGRYAHGAQMPQITRIDEVTRVDVIEYGIYQATKTARVVDGHSPTGFSATFADAKLIAPTRNIPAQQGVFFGFRYTVVAPPSGTVAPFRFVTIFPAPGLRNPVTQQLKTQSEYELNAKVGSVYFTGYQFTYAWEASPGIWRLQVWYQGHLMVEQQFVVVRE